MATHLYQAFLYLVCQRFSILWVRIRSNQLNGFEKLYGLESVYRLDERLRAFTFHEGFTDEDSIRPRFQRTHCVSARDARRRWGA